jgi:hypothetical protein
MRKTATALRKDTVSVRGRRRWWSSFGLPSRQMGLWDAIRPHSEKQRDRGHPQLFRRRKELPQDDPLRPLIFSFGIRGLLDDLARQRRLAPNGSHTTAQDGGLRPIAVGDMIYRLATKAIVRHSKRHDFLLPYQFGVGSKGGVEPVVRAVERALEDTLDRPYTHLTSLDFQQRIQHSRQEGHSRGTAPVCACPLPGREMGIRLYF